MKAAASSCHAIHSAHARSRRLKLIKKSFACSIGFMVLGDILPHCATQVVNDKGTLSFHEEPADSFSIASNEKPAFRNAAFSGFWNQPDAPAMGVFADSRQKKGHAVLEPDGAEKRPTATGVLDSQGCKNRQQPAAAERQGRPKCSQGRSGRAATVGRGKS